MHGHATTPATNGGTCTPPRSGTTRRGVERARKSIKRPTSHNTAREDDVRDVFVVVEPVKRARKIQLTERQREKLMEKT